MISEGDYVLVTDIEDKNYLKVGIITETKCDADGILCACIVGFGYDQKIDKRRYESYMCKNLHRKFKILAFKE